MSKKAPTRWDFRDVSAGLKKLRNFLLGRKYVFHNRFPPLISPRSIPPPDVPRGPEYKYSDQYYSKRDVLNSVKPPVVAPIAEGISRKQPRRKSKMSYMTKPKDSCSSEEKETVIEFDFPPTPGPAWWFDGHCYFKQVPDICRPDPPPPCSTKEPPCGKAEPPPPPPPEPPCPVPPLAPDPCADPNEPPCRLPPCKFESDKPPPPPPPAPCDPCDPPKEPPKPPPKKKKKKKSCLE